MNIAKRHPAEADRYAVQPEGFDDPSLQVIAKRSELTIAPAYHALNKEVIVKPATAKGVIAHCVVSRLIYKPQLTWAFDQACRCLKNNAKKQVGTYISPSNVAFCGFLMMSR